MAETTYNPVKVGDKSAGTIGLDTKQLETLKTNNPKLYQTYMGDAKPLAEIRSMEQADIVINQNQADDIAAGQKKDDAPTRDGGLTEIYKSFSDLVQPKSTAPTAPSFEQSYNKLRDQYDVGDLEQNLNSLEAQEEALYAEMRMRRDAEMDKTVPLNVIQGRVGEVERQQMERIDFIRRQKQTIVNQLNAANAAIENVMTFRKMDYEVARDTYNDEFSRNLKMFDAVYGISRDQKSDKEAEADNARANLQVIYSSLGEGKIDPANIDPAQRYQITKLELEAGLPTGFYDQIASMKPDGKVLSTTTRTSGGAKYADVLVREADGSLSTQSVYLGASSEGSGDGKLTDSEYYQAARGEMAQLLNSKTGDDGKVSPTDYLYARRVWTAKGLESADFDKAFGNEFAKGATSPITDYQLEEKPDIQDLIFNG